MSSLPQPHVECCVSDDDYRRLLVSTGLPASALKMLQMMGAPIILSGSHFSCVWHMVVACNQCEDALFLFGGCCLSSCVCVCVLEPLRLYMVAYLHQNGLDSGPPVDVVELFSGVEAVTKGFRAKGLVGCPFDLEKQTIDDILSTKGMFRALSLARRLRPGV